MTQTGSRITIIVLAVIGIAMVTFVFPPTPIVVGIVLVVRARKARRRAAALAYFAAEEARYRQFQERVKAL